MNGLNISLTYPKHLLRNLKSRLENMSSWCPGGFVLVRFHSTPSSDRRQSYLFHIEWQSLFQIEYYMIYLCFKKMDEASQLDIEKQFHLATYFMLELRISNTLHLFWKLTHNFLPNKEYYWRGSRWCSVNITPQKNKRS